jgi:hypothetical protein
MLEARESAATFAKLTPLQPKIAALRKLILSQLGEGTLMRYLLLPFTPRYILLTIALLGTLALAAIAALDPETLPALALPLAVFGALVLLGICDLIQTRHAILRNYPIAAHIRFILEHIRPELRQYFFEAEKDGTPFPRDKRALVYQRAKQQLDTRPFGTHYDVYRDHYECLHHSIQPKQPARELFRTTIGGSVFNISAMSYGSLSANAIRALNKGAKLGDLAHDTGEGGVSRYHRERGGDLIWEVGSGYFCCRNKDGSFAPEKFAGIATDPQIKMVELKLSQGAKPGHGGVLPAAKVSKEISEDPRGGDGPGLHLPGKAFCVRHAHRDDAVHREPPLPFRRQADRLQALHRPPLGVPRRGQGDAQDRDHAGLYRGRRQGRRHRRSTARIHGSPRHAHARRPHLRALGAGRHQLARQDQARRRRQDRLKGFDMARVMALGADWCNAARGFMFAVGCLQSQQCHTDRCPTGVATQDRLRQRAIVISTSRCWWRISTARR